ncbi:MAG: hypothetical protein RIQ79_1216, partial [Verrucomicrobiota bacterium]
MLIVLRAWLRKAGFVTVVMALIAVTALARIGDAPEQMAGRMLQPNVGRNFSWPKDMSERERTKQENENPLKPLAYLLPVGTGEWQEQIFWKSA